MHMQLQNNNVIWHNIGYNLFNRDHITCRKEKTNCNCTYYNEYMHTCTVNNVANVGDYSRDVVPGVTDILWFSQHTTLDLQLT